MAQTKVKVRWYVTNKSKVAYFTVRGREFRISFTEWRITLASKREDGKWIGVYYCPYGVESKEDAIFEINQAFEHALIITKD